MVLLDRALGKVPLQITGADGNPVALLHLVAMRDIGEAVITELAQRQSGSVIIDGSSQPVHSQGTAVEVPAAAGDLGAVAPE